MIGVLQTPEEGGEAVGIDLGQGEQEIEGANRIPGLQAHDALQARYFMRKLQNDGIEAKIWTLVPTEDGVTAQAGSWKQRIQ